jgi:glutamyl-tRNA(Gln) amidotransferase subunit E
LKLDYASLGLKVGLEVHQQLDTGRLFSRTPGVLREDSTHFEIKRRLRPTASELGEMDAAAKHEFLKEKTFVYEGYFDTDSLVETDSEPIGSVNEASLQTTLEVALLSNAHIFDVPLVMRKLVIDGSNTSGFQRTILIASNGKIVVNGLEVGVSTIILEEDSARLIGRKGKETRYRLDRLGIPLIEFTTEPQEVSPKEIKEIARAIGELFRRTGSMKRGLGSIRQDINISIKGGARIELKGVQDLESFELFVEREVQRQLSLIELKKRMIKMGLKKSSFSKKNFCDVSSVFVSTNCRFLCGKNVFGVKLEKMRGLLGFEIQQGRRFGSDISSQVKARTDLGILHSDELPKHGVSEDEVLSVRNLLGCKEEDAFAIVCGKKECSFVALETVLERCAIALDGVPSETRNALLDGNSEYSRPISGSERMYPETDIAPLFISKKELVHLKKNLPLETSKRKELYVKKFGLSEKLADEMKRSNRARFFEETVKRGFNPKTTAVFLLEGLTQLKREKVNIDLLSKEMILELLEALKKGKISQDVLLQVAGAWVGEKELPLEHILKKAGFEKADEADLRKKISEIVHEKETIVKSQKERAIGPLMGIVMAEFRGKADGKAISRILSEEIRKVIQ